MSYHIPDIAIFTPPAGEMDFGGGANDVSFYIAPKPGKKLRIDEIYLQVTEAFDTPLTTSEIQVGDDDDAEAFGKLVIADDTPVGGKWFTRAMGDLEFSSDLDNGGDALIDADKIKITLHRGTKTGGGAGGKAIPYIYGRFV